MTSVRFEWDEAKNLSNQRKHDGVSFEDARQVFQDPLHVSVQERIEGGEQRWQTVGAVQGVVILLVAHTVTEDDADGGLVEIIRPHDGPRRERGDTMKTKLDYPRAATLPAPTDAQRDHLDELAALPDGSIDTSDIPELSDEAWSAGVRGRFYRPVKQQITARVDADVLDWLKSQGKGYQGRLNAILRREMLASVKQARRA